ncbi:MULTISPECIES: 5,6-dimethylbenzimidazole synthase [unclassified Colwellia]|uniref:5,6-dimethylbenzimidazole synthase n=1 Tax=unclassified Colwellia TaxID=196834 RepID=UPI0015F4A7D1|nr:MULTISPECIES: 5,6-dimethylbenzimidazole synthase [unclassified Colwellia]MBA6233742.1 5,6-dimethylbenzimidazole synthase [Colwellia sp. MB02u-7]MBA6237877.1 5,6-dimethylbenzimidazole synthase [Colwellia sp. MB02u-11]MBA6257192.1 5,6-dimethylbenzimidazole synthase [Colwellia sp. MB3u-28]MBA6258777.1 5,6-dimethylbenzimidazole synthase [Colwellia sp. MB3u-41]MBA6300442.1 5,6-dimethylbenzimidazole synthase [Colwellia sp. MB3u-22]
MNISEEERNAVYKTIFSRRDVRSDFINETIPEDVLKRVLTAAHHAPSVGFMQPWDFIVINDNETKQQIKNGFDQANLASKAMFTDNKQRQYQKFKLEGILEAPIGICVTCDRERNGPVVLGKTIKPEMDLYSAVCAIQNLWLAARAENLGMGWVSIIEDNILRDALNIPEKIEIIAYLCIGYVTHFKDKPELESAGWLPRRTVDKAIHYNKWSAEKI